MDKQPRRIAPARVEEDDLFFFCVWADRDGRISSELGDDGESCHRHGHRSPFSAMACDRRRRPDWAQGATIYMRVGGMLYRRAGRSWLLVRSTLDGLADRRAA